MRRVAYASVVGDWAGEVGFRARRGPSWRRPRQTGSQPATVDRAVTGSDHRFRCRDRREQLPSTPTSIRTLKCREYERASSAGASYRPRLRTAPAPVRSVTDMAQHERRRDQRGSYENPRYGRPRHPDGQVHPAALPGVAAASARAASLSPDPAGMLTRGHRLTPRQPVEYCQDRRKPGIRSSQLVGYGTQGPLLPCAQAHNRHLRRAAPSRYTRSGSLVLPSPTSSRRLTESSMVRAAVPAVGGTGNHADFGHEPLAFTEPVARQPDHLLHHPCRGRSPRLTHLPHPGAVAQCSQRCGADAPALAARPCTGWVAD